MRNGERGSLATFGDYGLADAYRVNVPKLQDLVGGRQEDRTPDLGVANAALLTQLAGIYAVFRVLRERDVNGFCPTAFNRSPSCASA